MQNPFKIKVKVEVEKPLNPLCFWYYGRLSRK